MPETTSELSITAQLFIAAGVKRVVFVDDRFGITQERVQSDANDLSIEQLQSCGAFVGGTRGTAGTWCHWRW